MDTLIICTCCMYVYVSTYIRLMHIMCMCVIVYITLLTIRCICMILCRWIKVTRRYRNGYKLSCTLGTCKVIEEGMKGKVRIVLLI